MGSDHQIYTEGSFGIPAIYLNDWPDRFIHTTGDTAAKVRYMSQKPVPMWKKPSARSPSSLSRVGSGRGSAGAGAPGPPGAERGGMCMNRLAKKSLT